MLTLPLSLVFGYDRSYEIFGHKIHFCQEEEQRKEPSQIFQKVLNTGARLIFSKPMGIVTLGFVTGLTHQLAHALTIKIFTGKNSEITIYTNRLGVGFIKVDEKIVLTSTQRTVYFAAGPIANMTMISTLMISAALLKNSQAAFFSPILATIATIRLLFECIDFVVAFKVDSGTDYDFVGLKGRGILPFALTCAMTTTQLCIASIISWRLL